MAFPDPEVAQAFTEYIGIKVHWVVARDQSRRVYRWKWAVNKTYCVHRPLGEKTHFLARGNCFTKDGAKRAASRRLEQIVKVARTVDLTETAPKNDVTHLPFASTHAVY